MTGILGKMNYIKIGISSYLVLYYENSFFFRTLSGVMKPSPSIGFRCRVSGFRLALAFSLLTPDTRHLSDSVQFSCNPSKIKELQLFFKAE